MTSPTEEALQRDSQQAFFAQWLDLNTGERQLRGLPATQTALAAEFNVSTRLLHKWKSAPGFKALTTAYKGKKNPLRALPLIDQGTTALIPQRTPSDLDPLEDLDLEGLDLGTGSEIQMMERIWAEKAKSDPQAFRLWFAAFGKAQQEAEQAQSEIRYDRFELEDLVAEGLMALGETRVIQYLEENGWSVVRNG